MKILFNDINRNVRTVLNNWEKQLGDLKIYDSSMENTLNFIYKGIKFYLMYDQKSENNKDIYMYVCESHASNDCEESDIEKEATNQIYSKLKGINSSAELAD